MLCVAGVAIYRSDHIRLRKNGDCGFKISSRCESLAIKAQNVRAERHLLTSVRKQTGYHLLVSAIDIA